MSLPYGKVCDSDHYSICTKASATEHSWRDREQDREDDVGVVQGKRDGGHRGGDIPGSYTHIGERTAETRRVGVSGIPEGKSSLRMFDKFACMKYPYGGWQFGRKGIRGCNREEQECRTTDGEGIICPACGRVSSARQKRARTGRPVEEGARSAALAAALCGLAIGGLSQARKRCRHHAFTGLRHAAGLAGGHDLCNASHRAGFREAFDSCFQYPFRP